MDVQQAAKHATRPRVRRVDVGERTAALGVLLNGRADRTDGSVQQFVLLAQSQQLDLSELWAAYDGDTPVAASLIAPHAGRAGMLFVSPTLHEPLIEPTRRVVDAACAGQDPARTRLIQTLLETDQSAQRRLLLSAGFEQLAELAYMRRPAERRNTPLDLPEGVEAVAWSEANRPLFEQAILASYEQTRDCPGLVGVRRIEDIIAGHMASGGGFLPELWLAFRCGQEPVGCLMLNPLPQQQALELVYVGLALRWRGRGLAHRLLRHALGLAHEHRLPSLVLAVDQANAPAVALYRSLGFAPYARKLAMLRVLSAASGESP